MKNLQTAFPLGSPGFYDLSMNQNIEHLQFEWHLCQIHPSHLANRLVPSAASSSCFSLSSKYNLAMPGISGLSAVMRIFIHSVLERDTSSSSVIFADILVPTQAIKVHIATILEVKTPILLRLILYAQIGIGYCCW